MAVYVPVDEMTVSNPAFPAISITPEQAAAL